MSKEYLVTFTVTYYTTVQVPNYNSSSFLADAIEDIDIPETKDILYVDGSFEVTEVRESHNGIPGKLVSGY